MAFSAAAATNQAIVFIGIIPRFGRHASGKALAEPKTEASCDALLIILIVGEQGLGDEFMFANILPDVAEAVGDDGKLMIAVDPRLVPLFQRSYEWTAKDWETLWADLLEQYERIDEDTVATHFTGAIVTAPARSVPVGVSKFLVIDGQQRLTTITLLLTALRDHILAEPSTDDSIPSSEEIDDRFLRNRHGKGDRKNKLMLRRADNDALTALISRDSVGGDATEAVRENYEHFRKQLVGADVQQVYAGIAKLVIVDVSLTRGHDDPQMIFESLNSTGLDLTQADLIRNFVLMRLDDEEQTRLYEEYWRPIELAFGNQYRSEFDELW